MKTERVRSTISAVKPLDWYVKESATYFAPDGRANVIVSCEPLQPEADSRTYAEAQGELLREEFPQYSEQSFAPRTVFGDRAGFVRRFDWHPDDGEAVAQIQLYYAADGRGWTATATASVEDFAECELDLVKLLNSVRI